MLARVKAIVASRTFTPIWCGFVVGNGITMGLRAESPVAVAAGWGSAGFMLAMLIVGWMSAWVVRRELAVIARHEAAAHERLDAHKAQTQESISSMVEQMKKDMTEFAAERGFELDIREMDAPPSKWKQ